MLLSRSTGMGALAGFLAAVAVFSAPAAAAPKERFIPAQTSWTAPPVMSAAREGLAELPGTRLWYWDTGGSGEAVVLIHAYTGSYAMWAYQQQALAKAGYRVIGYSRRGHAKSDPIPQFAPGSATEDLRALLDFLKVDKAHLVGTAGGGLLVPDFALSYPQRVLSLTIASSISGIVDPDFAATSAKLLPPESRALPSSFKELGPSYRAGNPEGTRAWEELEHAAWGGGIRQPVNTPLTWDRLRSIKAPLLLMTGDADMVMPPSRMRGVHARIPAAELVIVAEAGHTIFWEQPEAFNSALLDFLRRNPGRR